jgi:DinB family protein
VTPAQRAALIQRYADGPAAFEAALTRVPPQAMQWRPAPGKWTVHEVVIHCADSETNAHMRIRYVIAETDPVIVGYDQDRWATVLGYHDLPLEPALATIRAVRANTLPLIRRFTEEQWRRKARHTEYPEYGAEKWLETYAEHLEVHVRQIARNLAAWEAGGRG